MKNTTSIKAFGVWLLFAAVIGGLIVTMDPPLHERHTNYNRDEFTQQLDSLRIELESSRKQTDSLFVLVDSVRNVNKSLSADIEQKDRELASIPGRYDSVPQDSLGIVMDLRATKR